MERCSNLSMNNINGVVFVPSINSLMAYLSGYHKLTGCNDDPAHQAGVQETLAT